MTSLPEGHWWGNQEDLALLRQPGATGLHGPMSREVQGCVLPRWWGVSHCCGMGYRSHGRKGIHDCCDVQIGYQMIYFQKEKEGGMIFH